MGTHDEFSKQMHDSIRQTALRVIAEEQKPGGSLFKLGQEHRSALPQPSKTRGLPVFSIRFSLPFLELRASARLPWGGLK